MVKIWWLTTIGIITHLYAQSLLESVPSQEILLSDWGLNDPSHVGYISVTIMHKEVGDELRVLDIRKQKPVLEEPSGPQGRVPPFEGDVFIVSHFNQGNTNRLGGYFNGFARSPSWSRVAIDKAPDGNQALIFGYSNQMPGFAGFWIHLFDFKEPPAERVFLDVTPFYYLTLFIRGETGSEKLQIRVADRRLEAKEQSLELGDIASFLPSTNIHGKWQQAWIPLAKLPPGLDQRELASLVFQVKGNGSGHVYLKNLAFTKTKGVQMPRAKEPEVLVRPLKKALWLWETEKIAIDPDQQQQFLTFCRTQGITDLFLQIPYVVNTVEGKWEIRWNSSPIRSLISKAHQIGIRVHALDGDPRFALKEWHGLVIAMIQS